MDNLISQKRGCGQKRVIPGTREGRRRSPADGVLQAALPPEARHTTAERGGEPPPGRARYSPSSGILFV